MRIHYGRMESEASSDERDGDFEDSYYPEDDLCVTYVVKTYAYCGMVFEHGEFETHAEALDRVEARIEWLAKQGSEVHKLEPDRWEVGEPENCNMVPDFCGTLVIKEIFK